MKHLTFIILVLFATTLQAKNYYISATGNDANDGLTQNTAWKSITKVNSAFTTFLPGDSILFKCGNTFTGSLVATKSGTAALPIVISSYGTGEKPVISGFQSLTTWSNTATNIWEATPAVALKNNVNILTINNIPYAAGRTPNSGYSVYQSATKTQLTSSALTGSYVGAEIVMKKNSYVMEKALITAQSGNVVTYTTTAPIDNKVVLGAINGTANFGFFLQRYEGSLDQFGEWFYNTSTKKMKIYSTVNPSSYTIKASYIDTVIVLSNKTNIIVNNLAIEGAGMYGVESYSGTNVVIRNCSFNNNTKAVYVWNTSSILIDKCTINNSFNGAILVSNNQAKKIDITNNLITNTGQLPGMGLFWSDANLKGIVARTDTSTAANYVNVIGNTVRNSGHAGIQFQGSNVMIKKNVVDTFCNQLDDNGGIYSFVNNQSVNKLIYTNRRVDSNFILNSVGAPAGSNNIVDVAGYYMDDQTLNVTGTNNTIAHVKGNGVQMNNPKNMTFSNNTVFDCDVLISVNKKSFSEISNVSIKKNILYQKDSTQLNMLHKNENLTLPTTMTIAQSLTLWASDSNKVSNMKYKGYGYYYSSNGSSYVFPPYLTLAQTQGTYLKDQHSILPPVNVTSSNIRFEINTTNSSKTVTLDAKYLGVDGTSYNSSITLAPFTSAVLIKSDIQNNIAPTVNAGTDKTITLPTSSITLTGSANDSDGTISSYAWVKISGPSAETIVSASSATTAVNGLVQGVYKFELTAKDNGGLVGKDTVQVTVNAAPVVPEAKANAGSDITIKAPANKATLSGSGTAKNTTIATYSWRKISGAENAKAATPNAATTVIVKMTEGVYQFELTVTDNAGAIGKDTVQITVNRAVKHAPVAKAGNNTIVTLPINTATLSGSGSVEDGAISNITWSQVSGPVSATIAAPASGTTAISNLVKGTYKYELTVTDTTGAIAKDTVQVTVVESAIAVKNELKVYPNPVRDITTVDFTTDAKNKAVISVTDMSGKTVKATELTNLKSSNQYKLDMSNLNSGFYIITVRLDNGQVLNTKVVKL